MSVLVHNPPVYLSPWRSPDFMNPKEDFTPWTERLLLEDGTDLLFEDGTQILLE